jgi:hypothetical protein
MNHDYPNSFGRGGIAGVSGAFTVGLGVIYFWVILLFINF